MKEEEKYNEEKVLLDFLSYLDGCVFIKSTNSVTGKEELLEPVVEDMEAIIKLSGEWDREDLKCFFQSILSTQQKDFDARVEWFIKDLELIEVRVKDMDNNILFPSNVVALAKQILQGKPEK